MQNVELVISSYTFWSRLWILYKNISYSVGVRCCQQSSLYCPPSVSWEKIRELSDWVTGGTEYYFNHLQLVIQEVNMIKCGWTILEKISSRDFIVMWRQVTDLTTVFSTPKITIHGKGQCFQQLLIRRVARPLPDSTNHHIKNILNRRSGSRFLSLVLLHRNIRENLLFVFNLIFILIRADETEETIDAKLVFHVWLLDRKI